MNTRLLFLAGTFLAAAPVTPAFAAFAEEVRQALHLAMEDARQALAESGLPHGQTLSVLPLQNDSDRYVEGLMKNAVTAAGMTYVEGREDPIWDDVLQEIEWAERKSDILDESTLTRFGRLLTVGLGGMLFIYGTVNIAMVTGVIPVLGVPLPFISYGGSALVTNLAAVGLILNVDRQGRCRARRTSVRHTLV